MDADGVLLAKDEVDDEVDRIVGVYQCVDVMNVTTVLSLLEKTITAVLVDIPSELDNAVVTRGVGPEYTEDVSDVGVLYTVEVAIVEVTDAAEGETDGDTSVVVVESATVVSCDALDDPADPLVAAVELEAAEQATFKVNSTPLLAQVESNVETAAVDSLVLKRCGNRLGDLTLLIGAIAT